MSNNKKEYRVSVSMSCCGRPQRTIRAVKSILNQSMDNYEILIFIDLLKDLNYWDELSKDLEMVMLTQCNPLCPRNIQVGMFLGDTGEYGYKAKNLHKQKASGKYFVFLDNDDVVLPNHLENYLSQIEGTDLDFAYYDTFVEPTNSIRSADLKHGCIGHSELIIRTDFLRQMPDYNGEYGHDWELVQNMVKAGAKYKRAVTDQRTYIIKSVEGNREQGID